MFLTNRVPKKQGALAPRLPLERQRPVSFVACKRLARPEQGHRPLLAEGKLMMKRLIFGLAALAILLGVVKESNAGPIDVSYTVSGSSGSYDLDFSVTNNMLAWPTQNVYFFAVRLGVDAITGSPAPFINNAPMDWNPVGNGGSNTNYDNTWISAPTAGALLPGTTLSGFIVNIPDLVSPTAVQWTVLAVSPGQLHPYTGGGNYNPQANPGFEGLAAPVPEPSTLVMSAILLGMLGSGWIRKRLKRSPAAA